MAARIGLIVPADFVLDRECDGFAGDVATVHVTRLRPVELPYDLEHAQALAASAPLREASGTFTPIRPAVIAFGCTMASFVGGLAGEARIRDALVAGGARQAVTTTGAFLDALRVLGARRVGLATPYPPRIAAAFTAFMREAGFDVAAQADRNMVDFERVVASTADEMAALVDRVAAPDVDVVFLAGTNTPAMELLPALAARAQRPVLSANQVTIWSSLRVAGLPAFDLIAGGAPGARRV
ncbi:MAG: Asp/Glu racemase [Chloroflexi bacterium]|nr:Asp/Glu racemase [Chloroflexota bacterium]